MKRIKRGFIVLIAMGLVVSLTMVIPASAQNDRGSVKVLDSEFVLFTMASTGDIDEAQVFSIMSLDGDGTVSVREEKAFDEVGGFQGVKGFTTPKVEGDYIVWPEMKVSGPENVIATTTLSEPMVEEARTRIPLDIRFKYWFDGEPVTDLETVTGKTGRFKMELTLTNTSKEMQEITYTDSTGVTQTEMTEVYLPLVILPYDWVFDNEIFFNVQTDPTGLVVSRPDNFSTGWSIPLFPPATEESHTIWMTADVKDFMLPPLTLVVSFHFPQSNQASPIATLALYIKAFYDGMVKVNEGIGSPDTDPSLLYGITAVAGGLQQLGDGLPGAKTAIDGQLIPGVNQAVAGIGSTTTDQTLLYASNASIAGLQGISAGIGSATTDATLLYAVNAIAGGLQGISDGIGSTTTGGTLLFAMNAIMGGMEGILAGIGDAGTSGTLLNAIAGIIGGLQQIRTGTAPPGPPTSLQTAAAALNQQFTVDNFPTAPPGATMYAYVNNNALYGGAMNAQDIAVLNGLMSGLNTNAVLPLLGGLQGIYDAIGDGSPGLTLMYAALATQGGLESIRDGIGAPTTPDTLLYAVSAVIGGLLSIQTGIGSATTPDTLLFAVKAIENGLNAMKGGIGDTSIDGTLLYALAAIQGGLTQLKAGLSSGDINDPALKEGLMMISTGIGDAVAGIGSPGTPDTLLYGATAIGEGLMSLGEGTSQLEAGLGAVLDNFSMTNAELEAIAMRGAEFDHFLGRAEGEDNRVAFVYQMKPTYNYAEGSKTSWIVAIVLSIIIALLLVAGGLLLSRRSTA
jgi:hypothetical protein